MEGFNVENEGAVCTCCLDVVRVDHFFGCRARESSQCWVLHDSFLRCCTGPTFHSSTFIHFCTLMCRCLSGVAALRCRCRFATMCSLVFCRIYARGCRSAPILKVIVAAKNKTRHDLHRPRLAQIQAVSSTSRPMRTLFPPGVPDGRIDPHFPPPPRSWLKALRQRRLTHRPQFALNLLRAPRPWRRPGRSLHVLRLSHALAPTQSSSL